MTIAYPVVADGYDVWSPAHGGTVAIIPKPAPEFAEAARSRAERIALALNYCADLTDAQLADGSGRMVADGLVIALAEVKRLRAVEAAADEQIAEAERLWIALMAAHDALSRAVSDLCVVCPGGAEAAQRAAAAALAEASR